MWLKKIHPGIAVGLMVCGALMLTGGVSEIMVKEEPLELSEPDFMEVSNPEIQGVTSLKSAKATKGESLKSGAFVKGELVHPEPVNPAYTRCARLESFDEKRQCAIDALQGISSEDD